MRNSQTRLGRRGLLRAGIGVGAAATLGEPAMAQDDPYDGWFADTSNYNGTVDRRGQDSVTVSVGAGDTGILFDPPAIVVDPGTTVVWEWTGEGGAHNVSEENGVFESETIGEAGHTFEHTFGEDTDGEIFRYVCTPHQALGMVGAVAVGDAVEATAGGGGGGGSESGGAESGGGGSESSSGGSGGGDNWFVSGGALSTQGFLTTVIGVIGLGLLSPVLFALVLKRVYTDDKPTEDAQPPIQ
ncbi:halocyanin domain-containing protein [Halonotius terrestris]|uniref:Halocyanin domain-containing protein n=1 Tax=Halonotius terrestris TaxID=2487750 RepID=A0A8J8TB69_9EURY|nr:halocyanin domain-containing protein [Halonotius terrestris]TQQ79790.1 halocyanin domain-containing protein [Halonotius terrestris]